MSQFINVARITINGEEETNIKTITEFAGGLEIARQVKLMKKTGSADVVPRYMLGVDYVYPLTETERDWAKVKDATVEIIFDNGSKNTYTGVRTLNIGEKKIDPENDTVSAISLMAENKV
jgi:hypothetical protein